MNDLEESSWLFWWTLAAVVAWVVVIVEVM